MATRIAARYISRRLSSSGRVLSEKEKAAGNVCIKKLMEQEKLDKLAQEAPAKTYETPAGSSKPSGDASSDEPKWLAPCVLLFAVGSDVGGEHNMPLFSVIASAGLGAKFILPSKHTTAVGALVALAWAGASGYAVKCWDLKLKTEEVEE